MRKREDDCNIRSRALKVLFSQHAFSFFTNKSKVRANVICQNSSKIIVKKSGGKKRFLKYLDQIFKYLISLQLF